MPKYTPIELGFSTADGERIELQFVGGEIRFSFADWRGQIIRFAISDVRAFSWLEELDVPEIRNDCIYEVLESDLIEKYCAWNAISRDDGYRHFKFCFNAAGIFDVLCKGVTVI